MKELGVPLVRRQSGGGTVFHDLGNVNYCVMVPKKEFDMSKHCFMIKDSLNTLSVPAYVTKRNDIEVDGFKVSGSAYRIIRDKAFHHGTMLVDTETTTLRYCIGNIPYIDKIISKATRSVRSPVANIKDFAPRVSTPQFMEAVMAEFEKMYKSPADTDFYPVTIESSCDIAKEKECFDEFVKLQTPEWIYGNTPDFEVKLGSSKLKIHRGLFHDIEDQDVESKTKFERSKGKYFSWDELEEMYSKL